MSTHRKHGKYEDKFWGAVGSIFIIVLIAGICGGVWLLLTTYLGS